MVPWTGLLRLRKCAAADPDLSLLSDVPAQQRGFSVGFF